MHSPAHSEITQKPFIFFPLNSFNFYFLKVTISQHL